MQPVRIGSFSIGGGQPLAFILGPCVIEGATQTLEIKQALRAATDDAAALGVIGVPTIAIDGELFWGDDRLEDAAAHQAHSER